MLERIVSYRGAMDIALPIHAKAWGSAPAGGHCFFFPRRFVLFCFAFLKTYFHFLEDINCKLIISFHF